MISNTVHTSCAIVVLQLRGKLSVGVKLFFFEREARFSLCIDRCMRSLSPYYLYYYSVAVLNLDLPLLSEVSRQNNPSVILNR
jgi:hypothetical protein